MTSRPEREELRFRLEGQPAEDLRDLMARGSFRSTSAAAQYVVASFAGSMARGLRRAQETVEDSIAQAPHDSSPSSQDEEER